MVWTLVPKYWGTQAPPAPRIDARGHKRGFIGIRITVHYIDAENLERVSNVSACRRFNTLVNK